MNFLNKLIFFILISLGFTAFNLSVFAINKAVYPDSRLLQPMPADTYIGAQENMNSEQAQEIRNMLNDSGQTIDSQKLSENIKNDNSKIIEKINQSGSNVMWAFIIFMFIILVSIMGFRFFQKDKK
jgi:hypothetical protein